MRFIKRMVCCGLLLLALNANSQTRSSVEPQLEHMTVTARRSLSAWERDQSPLNQPLDPRSANVPVANLADLLQNEPGLAYAGQGGLLQTVSIRGISGQRVANFYGDVPIHSERRAGTSSSFIDPLMLQSAAIIRGPASVYYGSGAVAGVLQLQPARPAGAEAQLQWGSEGDENLQYLGYGNQDVALAFSRRAADDSEAEYYRIQGRPAVCCRLQALVRQRTLTPPLGYVNRRTGGNRFRTALDCAPTTRVFPEG